MRTQTHLLTAMLLSLLGLSACKPQTPESETPATPDTSEAAKPMSETPAATGPVKFKVEFKPSWTKANFPFEYPDTSMIHKPHFSGWIGTAHNNSYDVYEEGAMPTPGLEALSESGKHSPLDNEIKAAIAAGNALALSESGPLKDFSRPVSFEISVDDTHPLVSLVAMIAPSPDWFAGVSDVDLRANGGWGWVASKTVDAMAWDSGGDDGMTYLADDKDANPKKPTMPNTSKQLTKDGRAMPVGTLTFTKM